MYYTVCYITDVRFEYSGGKMDFSSRVGQARQQQPATHAGAPAVSSQGSGVAHTSKKKMIGGPRWFRVTLVALIACIAVLAIAIAFSFYVNGSGESQYISSNQYQAVFLNNGQVYFGKIKTLNDHYFNLTNIFYLSTQSAQPATAKSTSGSKFSLVKLGCELHGPEDQMLVNAGQVTFWENLRANGQVVQAINKWYQQNPNGLNCSSSTSS
jgi:hypothetical protein